MKIYRLFNIPLLLLLLLLLIDISEAKKKGGKKIKNIFKKPKKAGHKAKKGINKVGSEIQSILEIPKQQIHNQIENKVEKQVEKEVSASIAAVMASVSSEMAAVTSERPKITPSAAILSQIKMSIDSIYQVPSMTIPDFSLSTSFSLPTMTISPTLSFTSTPTLSPTKAFSQRTDILKMVFKSVIPAAANRASKNVVFQYDDDEDNKTCRCVCRIR